MTAAVAVIATLAVLSVVLFILGKHPQTSTPPGQHLCHGFQDCKLQKAVAMLIMCLYICICQSHSLCGTKMLMSSPQCKHALSCPSMSTAIAGVAGGFYLSKYQHKLPCCVTLRSSELDEVLVTPFETKKFQTKTAADGKQRIAISASTTQSVESNGVIWFHMFNIQHN